MPTPKHRRQRPGSDRPPDGHSRRYELFCIRCQAIIAVTELIGAAEMRGIVAHLRGCIPDLFRASERPTFDELFQRIRVRKL